MGIADFFLLSLILIEGAFIILLYGSVRQNKENIRLVTRNPSLARRKLKKEPNK